MDKDYFIKLLQKYQQEDVTKEERQFLESYYDLFQNEPNILDTLSIEEKNKFEREIKETMWNNISNVEKASPAIRFINKRFIKVAAAAAIFTGIISSLFFFYHISVKKQDLAGYAVQKLNNKSNNLVNNTSVIHQRENRVIFLPDGST